MAGPEPSKPTTIDFALDQEGEAIDRLAHSIGRLTNILDPILTPPTDEARLAEVMEPTAPRSRHAATLEDHIRRIERLVESVTSLCQRSELVEHEPVVETAAAGRAYAEG